MFPSWPYPPSVLQQDALAHLWLDTAESDGGAARVRLCGELDITTVADLARWVELLRLDSRERLVIDLSAVTFCDAAGLGALTTLHRNLRSEGRQLTLHDVPMAVRRIMAITGDDRDLDVA
jgi:anti-anti-sigma factor